MSQALKWEAISAILLVFSYHPVLPQNDTNTLQLPINGLDGLSQALARLVNQVDVTTSTPPDPDTVVSQSFKNNTLVSFFQTNGPLRQKNGNITHPVTKEAGSGSLEDTISATNARTNIGDALGKTPSPARTSMENTSFPKTTEFSPSGITENNKVDKERNSANVTARVTPLPATANGNSTGLSPDSALTQQTQEEVFTSMNFPRTPPMQESTSESPVLANPERPNVLHDASSNLNLTGFNVILQLLRKSFTSLETTTIPTTATTTAKPVLVKTDLQSILKSLLYQNGTRPSSNQSTLTTTTVAPEISSLIDAAVTKKENYVRDIVDGIIKVLHKTTDTSPSPLTSETAAYVTPLSLTRKVPESTFVSDAPVTKKEGYVKVIVGGIVNVLLKKAVTTPLPSSNQSSKYVSSTTFTRVVPESTFITTEGSSSSRPTRESRKTSFAAAITVTNQPTKKPPLSQNQVLNILGNLFQVSPSSTASGIVQKTKATTTTARTTTSEAALQESVISSILDKLVNDPQSTMISSAMLTSEESTITSTVDATSSGSSTSDFRRGERTEKSVSRGTTLTPFNVVGIVLMILTSALSEI